MKVMQHFFVLLFILKKVKTLIIRIKKYFSCNIKSLVHVIIKRSYIIIYFEKNIYRKFQTNIYKNVNETYSAIPDSMFRSSPESSSAPVSLYRDLAMLLMK